MRGAGRAAVQILYLCAFASLAIPVSSLIAVIIPDLGIWWHRSTSEVDLAALALAALFVYAARITVRRIRSQSDSVWAI